MASGLRWTPQMLREFQQRTQRSGACPAPAPAAEEDAPAPSKYRSAKVEMDGIKFDSKKEARRWFELVALLEAGEITDLQRQVSFELAPAVRLDGEKRKKPALRYVADAVYRRNGELVVEDTKSPPTRKTQIYRAKRHLMATVLGLQIREV